MSSTSSCNSSDLKSVSPLNPINTNTIDNHNNNSNNTSDNSKVSKLKPPVPLKRKNKEKTKDDIVLPGHNSGSSCSSSNKSRTNVSTSNNNNNNSNKSDISSNCNGVKRQKIEHHPNNSNENLATTSPIKIITSKPPLPPPKMVNTENKSQKPDGGGNLTKLVKPVKMKKKLEESSNSALVQKLSLLADKLRLENAELLKTLASEKSAVRTLRAQNEAESRRTRIETKKLQDTIVAQNKLSIRKEAIIHHGTESPEYIKLNQELLSLKDSCKSLEEKLQISSEVERKLSTDILEMKDMYELRLTQANNTASIEIEKMLEEIKTKDRCIGQLKKEITSFSTGQNKNVKSSVQEMRKLKDTPTLTTDTHPTTTNGSSSINNSCSQKTNNKIEIIETTCGDDDFVKMPHETSERILEAHNELNIYRSNKNHSNDDHMENDHNVTSTTDTDSALSSAPSSLSPQPISCPNSPDIWKTFTKDNRINGHNKYDHMQKELDAVREENEYLKIELESAQEQIRDLEKTLFELKETYSENLENELMKNLDKIKDFEEKEETLLKETHELREQNELLEFRIIELEESHDKWSLRSNTTPDTRDVWTDTEKENDELQSDRTDSGITSPSSNNLIEDHTCSTTTPLDLSIDHIQQDDVRKRLTLMLKRSFYDDDDKLCLLQVLSLLNNLEALSQDQEINGNDLSLDLINNTSTPKPKSLSLDYLTNQSENSVKSLPPNSSRNQRIVATVLPYSASDSNQTPTRTRSLSSSSIYQDSSPKKARFCSSTSLQESGVFEGDIYEFITIATQTEPDDFPVVEKPNGDLCAEIQKLNKFRERIEECVTKAPIAKSPVGNILAETPEQRRLQYYRDRLEHLENKILIYESSGDLQERRLTDRLQREIQLDSMVKQLSEKIEKLVTDNLRLEEEKCEFEEAENDTRLRLQRIEFDLEILSQRNIELEMSRNSLKTKSNDYQQHCHALEEGIQKYQDKIFCLEEHENEMRHQMEMLGKMIPLLVAFHAWRSNQNFKVPIPLPQTSSCSCLIESNATNLGVYKNPLEDRLNELMQREKELTRNINELNKAYNETLENADNLWAQMERDYKEKIQKADETENALKCKLFQLEERLKNDTQFAQERLSQLEENENNFKQRLARLYKENKDLSTQLLQTQEELYQLREENGDMKEYLESTKNGQLDKEKRKSQKLEEDLEIFKNLQRDTDGKYKNEMNAMKTQLNKTHKELIHIEVTNGELKEEIFTLEQQIRELTRQHEDDEEKIKLLTIEMTDSNRNTENSYFYMKSLAQEMAPPSPRKRYDNNNLIAAAGTGTMELNLATKKLSDVLDNIDESCENCSTTTLTLKNLAKDVKKLAEAVIDKNSTSKQRVGRRSTTNLEEPTNETYTISKCSNCGCMHYRATKTCHQTNNVAPPPCWVDENTVPKRKDIVPKKSEGNIAKNGDSASRSGDQKRTSDAVRRKSRKSEKDISPSPQSQSQAQPPSQSKPPESVKTGKRTSILLPGATEATTTNGDKIKPKDQSIPTPPTQQAQPKASSSEPPIIPPTTSQSEQIISKSLVPGNFEYTEKFCCFLKKVKSTELFIRNLFKEEKPKPKPCPPPTDTCRATCGICVNDPCKTISGLVGDSCNTSQNCNKKSNDTGMGKCTNQNIDLTEIKNTVESLKEMMCKQAQNGCSNNDEMFQKILAELKKHVQQDAIDKLLKSPPVDNNTVAVIPGSTDPFVFIKCRPFCDQHGVFLVEWKVTSFLGIGGYEIYIDGILRQSIASAIRNTALIPGVNPKCEHLVTINAVPLPDCNLNSNDKWAPANCRYKPCCT